MFTTQNNYDSMALQLYKYFKYLPDTRLINHLIASYTFWRVHGYYPQSVKSINDYWFHWKTNPLASNYGFFVDKYLVKGFVRDFLGDQYVVPTIQMARTINEIADFRAPVDCVLKPSHASGNVFLKKAGERLTADELNRCQQWLKSSLFKETREYQYKYLQPGIIVEPQLTLDGDLAADYKFFCVRGEIKAILVALDRFEGLKKVLLKPDWTLFNDPGVTVYESIIPPKPRDFDEMVAFATRFVLFDFVRVDLYQTDKGIRLGELTFSPGNAVSVVFPEAVSRSWLPR